MLRALAAEDVPYPAAHIVQLDERVAPAWQKRNWPNHYPVAAAGLLMAVFAVAFSRLLDGRS
jgi:hypothetical protein